MYCPFKAIKVTVTASHLYNIFLKYYHFINEKFTTDLLYKIMREISHLPNSFKHKPYPINADTETNFVDAHVFYLINYENAKLKH